MHAAGNWWSLADFVRTLATSDLAKFTTKEYAPKARRARHSSLSSKYSVEVGKGLWTRTEGASGNTAPPRWHFEPCRTQATHIWRTLNQPPTTESLGSGGPHGTPPAPSRREGHKCGGLHKDSEHADL